jgi:hypothetical protein
MSLPDPKEVAEAFARWSEEPQTTVTDADVRLLMNAARTFVDSEDLAYLAGVISVIPFKPSVEHPEKVLLWLRKAIPGARLIVEDTDE